LEQVRSWIDNYQRAKDSLAKISDIMRSSWLRSSNDAGRRLPAAIITGVDADANIGPPQCLVADRLSPRA
jgi:hypothetical protein